MGSCRIPLVTAAIFLLVYPGLVTSANSTAASQQISCNDCYTRTCAGESPSCVKECWQTCPSGYYPITAPEHFVCEAPPTTIATTETTQTTTRVTTTTSTTTPQTTTATTTATTTTHSTASLVTEHITNPTLERRRRREADNQTVEETSTAATTTPTTVKSTSTTTPTTVTSTVVITTITTTPQRYVCKLCSINGCSSCKDDSYNNTVCQTCSAGYSASDNQRSCTKDAELSAGAIAGIVIGALCFITIVVLSVVFGVRYWRSRNGSRHAESAVKTLHVQKHEEDSMTDEQKELSKLGTAPTPPGDDQNKRYDSLAHTNETHSYTSLEDSQVYANLPNATTDPKRNKPANPQAASSSGNAYSNISQGPKKTTEESKPAEPVIYEPVESGQDQEEEQELYINTECITAAQNAGKEEGEDLYVNDKDSSSEEVYEPV